MKNKPQGKILSSTLKVKDEKKPDDSEKREQSAEERVMKQQIQAVEITSLDKVIITRKILFKLQ